jgi:transcriptional regulator with XRE-family HTH domain
MDRTPDEVAFDWGMRVRARRHRRGLTQQDVARSSGVPTSTQSRMELGRGATVSLGTWVTLASTLDEDLFGYVRDDAGVYLEAVRHIAEAGAWSMSGRTGRTVWLDRTARMVGSMRPWRLPAERLLIRVVVTVTDLETDRCRLGGDVGDLLGRTAVGCPVGGLLVVVRTTSNARRLSGTPAARSSAAWFRTLMSPGTRMPTYPGVVWLAPRATHLLPGA